MSAACSSVFSASCVLGAASEPPPLPSSVDARAARPEPPPSPASSQSEAEELPAYALSVVPERPRLERGALDPHGAALNFSTSCMCTALSVERIISIIEERTLL